MQLKINYEQLKKLESLTDKIKNDVLNRSFKKSILSTRESVSEYAFRQLEKSRIIHFDRKVQKNRIALGRIINTNSFLGTKSYLRFSSVNESLSSFPWRGVPPVNNFYTS